MRESSTRPSGGADVGDGKVFVGGPPIVRPTTIRRVGVEHCNAVAELARALVAMAEAVKALAATLERNVDADA